MAQPCRWLSDVLRDALPAGRLSLAWVSQSGAIDASVPAVSTLFGPYAPTWLDGFLRPRPCWLRVVPEHLPALRDWCQHLP